ncbi:MAG: VTT domain-containing protein [Cellulomonadaceae bacterium]|jgi:membrane-associated protein|nr:VTT domain-containing protein [Cellulomonadaceae bacterium]
MLDPAALLNGFGPWVLLGIAVVIFIESGVLFPFLPGDSLLVTAAILGPQLHLKFWQVMIVGCLAAVAGDQVGYLIGKKGGRRLFKPDARVLKTERLEAAENFFEKHGPISLFLGRFVPIVRTYVPLAAGTSDMRYSRFVRWNVFGAITWVCSMVLIGHFLGHVPFIANHIDVLAIVIVLVSVTPVLVHALINWRKSQAAAAVAGENPVAVDGAAAGMASDPSEPTQPAVPSEYVEAAVPSEPTQPAVVTEPAASGRHRASSDTE